jgi:hypothetical protein
MMQVLAPDSARRRASGISSPHSTQWVCPSPVGMHPRSNYPVRDGIVDLIPHRPVGNPPARRASSFPSVAVIRSE